MKITYDKEADAMYITFRKGRLYETVEAGDCFLLDQDKRGNILGLEILEASKSLGRRPEIEINNKLIPLSKQRIHA